MARNRIQNARWGRALLVGIALAVGAAAALEMQAAGEHARNEPSLPRFDGPLLGGGRGGSDLVQNQRALLYAFSSGNADSKRAAAIVSSLLPDAQGANLKVIGVAVGMGEAQAASHQRLHGFDFPVVLDPELRVARKLRLSPGKTALLVVDPEGYLIGGFLSLQDEAEYDSFFEQDLRQTLHLTKPGEEVAPELGLRPVAPYFKVKTIDGQTEVSSRDIRDKVAVVMFFSPTCPHCHEALQFMQKLLGQLATDDLVFVPISVSERIFVIESMLDDLELSLPVYLDPGKAAQKKFSHKLSVPDTVVIGRDGRVSARHRGVNRRVQALLRMEIRHALGVHNPILLERNGYSGSDFCQACHGDQHSTWSLTAHAYAFDTLVAHGEDRNPECLPCHTVGWEKPGGYSLANPVEHLEGVQCENCHGRGGPHQSPDFAAQGFEAACLSCHTPEHSLRFSFGERLPMVSHAANQQFANLSIAERIDLLKKRDTRERTLFEHADYVGSETCATCHTQEHTRWAAGPHAGALRTLESAGEAGKAECQACHTTGFGEPTGWKPGHANLGEVGCESCHGPGGKHVADGASKKGTILRLTEKCDSCVILQICGSCHDDANDPNFEFELNDKLDRIRHGFQDRPEPTS